MLGVHEMGVLAEIPGTYQLYYCLSHCGRIQLVRKEPFDVKILLTGDDEVLHKITEEDTEVVSIVLDDVAPDDLDKYVRHLEAENHSLAFQLFSGSDVEGAFVE